MAKSRKPQTSLPRRRQSLVVRKQYIYALSVFFLAFNLHVSIAQNPYAAPGSHFSTNGFFQLPGNNAREIFSFNNGWLYHKGNIKNAEQINLTDSNWQQVQLPHGTDILPEEASGNINYQGVVWYRKHFIVPNNINQKKLSLTFEAIMGKCVIYLNGKQVAAHKGGYLPVVIDLSKANINTNGTENIIAVMADNSDDASYPPGKPQYGLDFCYFGGIYRNVWLLATNPVHITDANIVQPLSTNGIKVSFENVSAQSAIVNLSVNIINESLNKQNIVVESYLKDKDNKTVAKFFEKVILDKNGNATVQKHMTVKNPLLWHPDHPYLYHLYTVVKTKDSVLDGYYQRIGIKSVILKGKDGVYINGKPFNDKLMGANHHQDYAYIGNAVPDNLFWNEAKKIREAGVRILRLSHYPQANAFMEACDALGIFTIVPTPGWQFWNNDSNFVNLMCSDIRQLIRQNRNHACIFGWEPIPNETHYPASFAKQSYEITHAEDPNPNCIAACDFGSAEWQRFDMVYAHPFSGVEEKTDKCIFTREWGDNVDNWTAHNSPSRANFAWGEVPQLVQAQHYANPSYPFESWERFYASPKQLIGGCLWHFFDTQRGYHPEPFYGGIVDMFRQPKYAYEMFKSQENPASDFVKQEDKNPYTLFIANIMSPFSPADVTVYSNCDSVKLVAYGKDSLTLAPDKALHIPHPPLVFKDFYSFMDVKDLDHVKKGKKTPEDWDALVAIGYVGGKEVIRTVRQPAKRPSKLVVKTSLEGLQPVADGSFIIPVFAEMQDENGRVKRLNESLVHFSVKGEGILIGDNTVGINPHKIIWGTAPALIKTTLQPGKIKIIASMEYAGNQTPTSDTLVLESVKNNLPAIYRAKDVLRIKQDNNKNAQSSTETLSDEQRKKILERVSEDQEHFMGNK